MTRLYVSTTIPGSRDMPVEAESIGSLVVHPAVGPVEGWSITEPNSGTRIAGFRDQQVAYKFAREIEPLLDWEAIPKRQDYLVAWEIETLRFIARRRKHESYIPTKRAGYLEYLEEN